MSVNNGIVKGATYKFNVASLYIVENPVKNSVKCQCTICGNIDGYKVSMLKNNEVLACKSCVKPYNIDDLYLGEWVIEQYVLHNNQIQFRLKHNKCGNLVLKSKEQLDKKECRCFKCNPFIKPKITLKPKENIVENKINSTTESDEPTKILGKSKSKIKSLGNIIMDKDAKPYKPEYVEINGDFVKVSTVKKSSKTGQSVRTFIIGQCRKCCLTSEISEDDWSKGICKCKKCDSVTSDNRNILRNTNWVGYINRNMKITKVVTDANNVQQAQVKCLLCNTKSTYTLMAFIYDDRLLCPGCSELPIILKCPLCNEYHIKSSMRSLYSHNFSKEDTSKYLCNKYNTAVDKQEIISKHEISVMYESIRNAYKGFTLDKRVPNLNNTNGVFKFKEHYTGRDGNEYYTCMCEAHNKLMVLTEQEMLVYNHEYCADTRMVPYKPKYNN